MRAAICLALALFAPACRPARSHPAGVDGKALYEKTCAQCHGVTGRGDTEAGRTLGAKDISRPEVKSLRDPELAHQIIVGNGRMPGFGGSLDDQEVRALVEFVRTLPSQ